MIPFSFQSIIVGSTLITTNGTTLYLNGTPVSGGSANWGAIGGTLSDQTDLETALNSKLQYAVPSWTYASSSLTNGTFTTNNAIAGDTTLITFSETFLNGSNNEIFFSQITVNSVFVFIGADGIPLSFTVSSSSNPGGPWQFVVTSSVPQSWVEQPYCVTIIPANPFGTLNGILKANGAGNVGLAAAGTDYLIPVTTTGVLKADGAGSFTAATVGTDYAPGFASINGIIKCDGGGNITQAIPNTDYLPPGSTPTLSTVLSASSITPIADGTYTLSTTLGGSITFQGGIVTAFSPAS